MPWLPLDPGPSRPWALSTPGPSLSPPVPVPPFPLPSPSPSISVSVKRGRRLPRSREPLFTDTDKEGERGARSPMEPSPRRHFGAGGRVPAAITHEAALPAPISRRRACLVRNPVGTPTPGVKNSPEGVPRTESRREPLLRRRFLAGGRVPAATEGETPAPVPKSRRRCAFRRETRPATAQPHIHRKDLVILCLQPGPPPAQTASQLHILVGEV